MIDMLIKKMCFAKYKRKNCKFLFFQKSECFKGLLFSGPKRIDANRLSIPYIHCPYRNAVVSKVTRRTVIS